MAQMAQRRIRRKRPMAPPPSPWGAAGGGFGGENMYAPAVMPPEWSPGQPAMGMVTGGGYGPGPGAMQPGGPVDQFAGGFGGAQQFGPPPGGGLLGNMMGGGMGQPQPAVMPPMGQPGMPGGAMAGGPPMAQPGMGGGMGQPTIAPPAPGGGMGQPETPYDPGVSAGRLAEAQRLAGLGQMGRAKQQWELGGGDWGGQAHRFLKG